MTPGIPSAEGVVRKSGTVSMLPVHDGDGYSWGGDIIVTFGDRSINLGTSQNYSRQQEIKALGNLLAIAPDLLENAIAARDTMGRAADIMEQMGKSTDAARLRRGSEVCSYLIAKARDPSHAA